MSTIDITYTATRSVIGSHTIGNAYTLTFSVEDILPAPNVVKNAAKSLSGVKEVLGQRIEKKWRMKTELIADSDYAAWQEFFDSVAYGEEFTLDMTNILATPSASVQCTMDGQQGEERVTTLPMWSFTFTAEQVV